MSAPTPSLRDDLDYIRDLAESGARAPLLGGRFLAWWGGVVTLAYLGHYLAIEGVFGLAPRLIPWMWLAFMIVGLGGFFILLALMPRDKPGRGSAGNRAEQSIWMFAGLAIFAFFLGAIAAQFLSGAGAALSPNASLPLVFAVYAVSLATTGALAANRTLQLAGWTALILVAVTTALQGSGLLYLAAAAGAFLTVFLPGLALLRAEPKLTV